MGRSICTQLRAGPDGEYVRVTVRLVTGLLRTFWAAKPKREGQLTRYLPLNREGERIEKKIQGGIAREVVFASDKDIVHEFKAYLDKTYGELQIL